MLIGTSDIRAWLSLQDGDKTANPKFGTLLLAMQAFVENYTHRALEASYYENHRDHSIYDGPGQYSIFTKQYPISYVSAVYVDANRQWSSGTLIASADLVVYWDRGEIYSEGGYFTPGRRNVRIDYTAGYGPTAVSSYPVPYDLKQVMIEMVVQAFKEGITGVHTVQSEESTKFLHMLSRNSTWTKTLNGYKRYDVGL